MERGTSEIKTECYVLPPAIVPRQTSRWIIGVETTSTCVFLTHWGKPLQLLRCLYRSSFIRCACRKDPPQSTVEAFRFPVEICDLSCLQGVFLQSALGPHQLERDLPMRHSWQIDAHPGWLQVGRPHVRARWNSAGAYRGTGCHNCFVACL